MSAVNISIHRIECYNFNVPARTELVKVSAGYEYGYRPGSIRELIDMQPSSL
jgi:hypothetical protein